jgi:hypothetical protein
LSKGGALSLVAYSKINLTIVSSEITLSPIENAVNAVAAKNTELQELFVKFSQSDNVVKIDRLSMALQGVLDAAVNGGTAKVRTALHAPHFSRFLMAVACSIKAPSLPRTSRG